MDFDLTAEQRDIRRMTREFAQEYIVPRAVEWDRSGPVGRDVVTRLAGVGLLGVCTPERFDGSGADYLSLILAIEEISRADAGVGVLVAVQNSVAALPILEHGTEEQRRAWLPRLASGELVGAYALTEPQAGSDAASLLTSARRDGDGYVLDGAKQFITNAGLAGLFVVMARTGSVESRARGISAFLVDAARPGITLGREEEKLGLHSASCRGVHFDGVRVPASARLGDEGNGFIIAMQTLDGGRIGIAAQAIGITQAAFDVALAYAKERRQFGRPLTDFQSTQWKLADMDRDLDAARLLTYRAAWLKMQGRPHTAEGAKAKLYASEMARRHTAEALQILGGYGYMKEYLAERFYRDAKVTEIYEGTSEIQRLIIARELLARS